VVECGWVCSLPQQPLKESHRAACAHGAFLSPRRISWPRRATTIRPLTDKSALRRAFARYRGHLRNGANVRSLHASARNTMPAPHHGACNEHHRQHATEPSKYPIPPLKLPQIIVTHGLTPMSFPLKHRKAIGVPGPGQAGLPLARIVGGLMQSIWAEGEEAKLGSAVFQRASTLPAFGVRFVTLTARAIA
jgi:hypothetical protein